MASRIHLGREKPMDVDNQPNIDAERGGQLNQSVEHLELQLAKV